MSSFSEAGWPTQIGGRFASLFIRAGIILSVCILAISSILKLISISGRAVFLSLNDPVIGLKNREVLLSVGILELLLAIILVLGKQIRPKILLIAGFSWNLLLYRLGLAWVGEGSPCPCLGNPPGWIHLSRNMADRLAEGMLVSLLAFSWGSLILIRRKHGSLLK